MYKFLIYECTYEYTPDPSYPDLKTTFTIAAVAPDFRQCFGTNNRTIDDMPEQNGQKPISMKIIRMEWESHGERVESCLGKAAMYVYNRPKWNHLEHKPKFVYVATKFDGFQTIDTYLNSPDMW